MVSLFHLSSCHQRIVLTQRGTDGTTHVVVSSTENGQHCVIGKESSRFGIFKMGTLYYLFPGPACVKKVGWRCISFQSPERNPFFFFFKS